MNEFLETEYNPDVLECIANLSNDEVFTPPKIANAMLELLPKELFCNPNTKFLDPCCKSGVFLREIAKRLLKGLKEQIPDLQERIDHIFKNQIYGISLTNLTSLLSRRSVYCAKKANSKYSVTEFTNDDGNIFFSEQNHFWINGKCLHCGISETSFNAQFTDKSEKHAYQFIHERLPGEIENMKFDVIIGNPPYQMSDGGAQASASPIYQYFIEKAKKLNPKYLCMIIPARWYAGGKGLDKFRENMLKDKHIVELHDFTDASECFSGVEIKGGVCYFLWNRDTENDCKVTSHLLNNITSVMTRPLLENDSDSFIRYNEAISILRKVQVLKEESFSTIVSSRKPFGLETNFKNFSKEKSEKENTKIYANQNQGYVNKSQVSKNENWINLWKILIPKAVGSGKMNELRLKPIIAEPNSCCTETYVVIGPFEKKDVMENCENYVKTTFFHFMLGLKKYTQDTTSKTYAFVPLQDFTSTSDIDWTKSIPEIDAQLYKKYNLTQEEIEFIESMIRPMQ